MLIPVTLTILSIIQVWHVSKNASVEQNCEAFYAEALYPSTSREFGGKVGLGASAGRKGRCSWMVLSRAGSIGLIADLEAT